MIKQRVYLPWNLPRLASYVFIYSDVINCETSAVFPTPASPIITTRYLRRKKRKKVRIQYKKKHHNGLNYYESSVL